MQNIEEGNRTYDLKIFISSEVAASGIIEVPGQGWSTPFTVVANGTTVITVPTDVGHVVEKDIVVNRAIHIISDADINVFAMNYSAQTTDGSLILPTNALGYDYWTLCYTPLKRSEFAVVAYEDNTLVAITPSAGTVTGKAANVTFNVTLNKGDVYQMQSDDDLTGSRIRSVGVKKKFAVFSGATCANIPTGKTACDHLFEQMFPNNTLRRNFVAVPFKTRLNGDSYRILATRNGTTVTFDGGSPMTLNAGQWQETIISAATYISSNYPIAVAQYSNGSGYDNVTAADPFFIMLSPVEQTREDITFEVFNLPTITGNYVNIAAKTSCISQITIDAAPVTGWATVPGNPSYSFVQLDVSQGPHRLLSSQDCGFNAYVYGYGSYDSYGYSAGVRLDTLAISMTANTDCANKGTEFFVSSYPYPITSYDWDFGDANKSVQPKPTHIYKNGGNYTVKLIVTYDNGDRDTVTTQFTIIEPVADFEYKGGMCVNDLITFTNKSSVIGSGVITQYNWNFGDGNNATSANSNHSYTTAGTYRVIITVTTANLCVDRDTMMVKINPLPQPRINPPGPIDICTCDSIELDAGNLGYVSYNWSTGAKSQKIIVRTGGTYTVTVTDTNGCTNTSPGTLVNIIVPSATITLGKPNYKVEPGDTIPIPVIISKSANLDFCKSFNWLMTLTFDKFIMVPVGNTTQGSMINRNRVLDLSGTRKSGNDTLAVLQFMGTLGDTVTSQMMINEFDWTDCNFRVSSENSSVILDSLCDEGGTTRLFRSPQSVYSLMVNPNPAGETTEISYQLGMPSVVRIVITDISAKKVTEIYQGLLTEGEHKLPIDVSNLSNGVYMITVQTTNASVSKMLEVQK
jgi:chitodextrinase